MNCEDQPSDYLKEEVIVVFCALHSFITDYYRALTVPLCVRRGQLAARQQCVTHVLTL